MPPQRKIICLTPVKNEAWILHFFIRAAQLWADHIIIADQGSGDGSPEIAASYDRVTVIKNEGRSYNESERQQQLLHAAREIEGTNNVFIALDADELLVNYHGNPQWKALQNESPGTTIWLPWLNVMPGGDTYYASTGGEMLFGYIDDGRPHKGNTIHSPRVPSDLTERRVVFDELKVLHFQYAFPQRLLSKHRWYECFEKIKHPHRNNIDIYRQYHHIDLAVKDTRPLENKWLEDLENNGLQITNIQDNKDYWWDKEVCNWFDTYGVERFRKVAIWYVDWTHIYALQTGREANKIRDPRSWFDKWVHRWLAASQGNRFSFWNKVTNKLLRWVNW